MPSGRGAGGGASSAPVTDARPFVAMGANLRGRPQALLVVLPILLGLVAAVLSWSWRNAAPRHVSPPPVLGTVPPFQFIDQDGRPVTLALLQGRITICQMIYSRCTTICPLLLGRFAELDQNFRRSTRLQLLSLSTDPAVDQPPALAGLRRRYEGSPHWVFVTGAPAEVARFAANTFGTAPHLEGERLRAAATGTPTFVLVDEEGQIRRKYPGLDAEVVPAILDDVGTLLRAERSSTR